MIIPNLCTKLILKQNKAFDINVFIFDKLWAIFHKNECSALR